MKNPASSKTTPCCSKIGLKRGPWTPEEDEVLATYIKREGEGRWRTLPKRAGLLRCGKSCRLRWMNYLRPSVKRGQIAPDEEDLILRLHRLLGNRWSLIAGRIPGRTDNEIKNYWNTHLSKKLVSQGIDPRTHKPLNSNPLRLHDTITSMATAKASASKPIPNNTRPSRIAAPQLPNPNPTPPSACENNCNNNSASENSNSNPQGGSGTTHRKSVSVNKAAPFYGYSDGPSYDHYHTGILLSSGGDNVVNLQGLDHDRSGVGLTTSKSINSNGLSASLEEDEDINHGADDVLSSFLNSLMNEDMFTAQNQIIQQLQLQPQQPPSGNIAAGSDALIPSHARTAFSFGANWDAPLMSTPSAFNHNDH